MQTLGTLYSRALVTGGSSGLGRSFVEMLASEGIEVWTTSRNPKTVPIHPNIIPIQLDFYDSDAVNHFVADLKEARTSFDLLINNAGSGAFFPFEEFPVDEINRQIQLLFKVPLLLCHTIYPLLELRNKGAIVNISSLAAQFPIPYMSMYNCSKAALSTFTASLIQESHHTNVKVIDFQLGDFRTAFNRNVRRNSLMEEKNKKIEKTWDTLEWNMQRAPKTKIATNMLRQLLASGKSGRFRCGSFFQACCGPFLSRFLPDSVVSLFIRKYFHTA